MEAAAQVQNRLVSRISMSLPEELLVALDQMVTERGFASRSQAISEILHQSLVWAGLLHAIGQACPGPKIWRPSQLPFCEK